MNTGRPIAGQCAQWQDIVEHVKTAAVRCDDQVVAVDLDVADRARGQCRVERLPVTAVVERDVKAPRSVPANSSPRRTGSSRTTLTELGPPFGRQAIDDRASTSGRHRAF